MNERIKLLAEQADGVFIHKLITGAKQYTFLEKDLEKFAQLIIEECSKLAEYAGYNQQFGQGGLRAKLHKHFGIEP